MLEFQLFDNRTYARYKDLDMVALRDGGYVAAVAIVAGSSYIAMRRFDAAGAPLSEETLLALKSGDARSALFDQVEVAALADGGFAVVWSGEGPHDYAAQLFAADGVARTDVIAVSEPYGLSGNSLDVVANSQSLFLAYSEESSAENIVVQTVRLADGAVSAPLTIGSYAQGDVENRYPALSVMDTDRVRLTYEKVNDYSVVQEGALFSRYAYEQDLFAVEINATGSAVLDARMIAADLPGGATAELFILDPVLGYTSTSIQDFNADQAHASLPGGRYALAYRPDGTEPALVLQIFEADGRAVGASVLVHEMDSRDTPHVVALTRGLAVLWRAFDEDRGTGFDIYGRFFTESGEAVGPKFIVHTLESGDQTLASVEPTADGGFVVAFESEAYTGDFGTSDNDAPAAAIVPPPNWPAVPGSDFDTNGADDILFFNAAAGAVGQFRMPQASWAEIGQAGSGWEVRGTGRFDNDDPGSDILWFNTQTRAVGRFDMAGGSNSGWDGMGKAGSGWQAVAAGDFNGDGIDDILWENAGARNLGQFRVDGSGQIAWRGIGGYGSGWETVGAGDFNNDGVDDLLFYNSASRGLGQFRMSEGGRSWQSILTIGTGYEVAGTGDFDADGFVDVLVVNAAARKLGYYDMEGGTPSWVGLGGFGAGWAVAGTGDYDGSGTDDILWRHADGRVGQYQMDGAARVWDSVGFAGAAWDIVA